MVMYDSSRDPPSSPELNSWHVLASTERWISATLADQASSSSASSSSNPYSRKEVSYACETFGDAPMIVASVFRRLREVRELGETHAKVQMELMEEHEGEHCVRLYYYVIGWLLFTVISTLLFTHLVFRHSDNLPPLLTRRRADQGYEPKTLRQTQVVVIPGNLQFHQSFATFDNVLRTINEARRQARDYVTKTKSSDDDWSISINCAHMHPQFGQLTREQELEQLKNEPDEVDLNYQEYQEKKMLARRSPYPTIVIEVRATPPMDFGESPPPSARASSETKGVSSSDIRALEVLFGQSAHLRDAKHQEDLFYDAIPLAQVSAVTPLQAAQTWMVQHDADAINRATQVAFTESPCEHVDAAHEFFFTNVAMMCENPARQYLVMPNFVPTSATSMEKFGAAACTILSVLPELAGKIQLETFHPEHVNPDKRSPMPVFVLEFTK